MSEESHTETPDATPGLRIGSWVGAAVSAFGLGACITVVNLGGTGIMDRGGFVASGGPYQIAHPAPDWSWMLPVAFIGVWVFPAAHGIFASRIKGFGLIYWTWCALWTSVGAITLLYGFNPPGGAGLAWGWLIMGSVFLAVGLGSTKLYVDYLRSPQREPSEMPQGRRIPYAIMILAALAAGVAAGFQAFASVAR